MRQNATSRDLAGWLFGAIERLVPVDRGMATFTSFPDVSDSSLAMFEHMLRQPRQDGRRYVWLVGDIEQSYRKLSGRYGAPMLSNTRVVKKNSLRGVYSFLRSALVFHTHGIFWFGRSSRARSVVNLWHGMPIKVIGHFDSKMKSHRMPWSTYTVATSAFFARLMSEAFDQPLATVLPVGLPRNAWLHRRTPRQRPFQDRAFIVWLPTFRRSFTGHLRNDVTDDKDDLIVPHRIAELDDRLDEAGPLVVIKLHPMDVKNHLDWPALKNVRLFKAADPLPGGLELYELLADAAALITDYSSAAIDFLELGRPIGLWDLESAHYQRGFMPGVRERIKAACVTLDSVDDALDFIAHVDDPALRPKTCEDLSAVCSTASSAAILAAVGAG